MKIQYLGHSSFLLSFERGPCIVTDPFGDVGIPLPPVRADCVTVSHFHYDHCNVEGVHTSRVLSEKGVFDVGGVHITAVECFHDEVCGRKRGKTLAFRFEAEGISLLHLGDIGEPCTPEVLRRLGKADVLFLPVGGNYTIDATEAKRYLDAIKPAIAIPMHYKVKGLTVDISGAERFLSLFEQTECAKTLTLNEKPIGQTKVILMERTQNVR